MKRLLVATFIALISLMGTAIAYRKGANPDCLSYGIPVITSQTTISASQNKPFQYKISASSQPTSYSATGLPTGLSLNASTGFITGTPTSSGSSSVALGATNSYGTGNATLSLTVGSPPVITSSTNVGSVYQGDVLAYTITGTNTPTSFGGSPLWNQSINSTTGVFSGTIQTGILGARTFTVSATNAFGTGYATVNATVLSGAPVITSSASASGTKNSAFTYSITATRTPTSYSIVGSLPTGLSVNTSTGVISGTPTVFGSFTLTIRATNSWGTGGATLVLAIADSASIPAITSSMSASGTQGSAITPYTITGSNSPTSYGATGLPTGLSVNTGTGVISGTPSVSGTYNVTISATNGSGTGTATLVFAITPSGSLTDPIPDARKYSAPGELSGWSAYTGVPGGIPTTRTQCAGGAVASGSSAATIQTRLNSCAANTYLLLSSGTYSSGAGLIDIPENVTLRGAGANNTRFSGSAWAFKEGNGTTATALGTASTSNATGLKGTKTITLANTTNLAVGRYIEVTRNDPAGLVNGPDGWAGKNTVQLNVITGIAGNVVTVRNPWIADFTAANSGQVIQYYPLALRKGVGLEDIGIDFANGTAGSGVIRPQGCDSCWIKGVEVSRAVGYVIYGYNALNIELRDSFVHDGGAGPNNSGFGTYGSDIYGVSANAKIENNIFNMEFPAIEMNLNWNANYIGYNYVYGSRDYFGTFGVFQTLDDGHAPFNQFNLYEGNIAEMFSADNYFGGAANGTALRNYFNGWNRMGNVYGNPIQLSAYAYNYNLVGNVLGSTQSGPNAFTGCGDTAIYRLGYPNLGNCDVVRWYPDCFKNTLYGSSLYTENGTPWVNDGVSCQGTSAAHTQTNGGYPDPHVDDTLMRWGNYDYFNRAVRWDVGDLGGVATPADQTIIKSYIYSAQPSWWKTGVAWPPIGPDVTGGNSDTDGYANKTPSQLCWESMGANARTATGGYFSGSACFQ
jgi:hypothetical protein